MKCLSMFISAQVYMCCVYVHTCTHVIGQKTSLVPCFGHHLTFVRDSISLAFPVPGRLLGWLDKDPR